MSGTRNPINVLSLLTAAALALGAVLAASKDDIYWTVMALWGFVLIMFPYFKFRGRDRSSISGLLPLVALPYIASYLAGNGGSGLLPLDSLWYLVLSSMALFALCVVTIALMNSVTGLKLNLKFAMQVAFMFYATVVIFQAPVFIYSDLLLGTDIIPGNTVLMGYVVLATINGLIMTELFFVAARAMMLRRSRQLGVPE
jgi:hypothetical protein